MPRRRQPPPIAMDAVPAQAYARGADVEAVRTRLGPAAGAVGIGISRYRIPEGKRSMPVHVHADEEELVYVLGGTGLSFQDGAAYPIGVGELVVHRAGEEAHTLIGGPGGLEVLIFAEGSRSNLTYLPRTGSFFLGSHWLPADAAHPFEQDVAAGPLEVPPPSSERPPNVVAPADVEPDFEDDGVLAWHELDLATAGGSVRSGLRHAVMPPDRSSVTPHWHTAEEEAFVVLAGGGTAVHGDEEHPIGPGSLIVNPPRTGVPHHLRSGPTGLTYLAYGTRVDSDAVFYPEAGTANIGGVRFRIERA